MPNVVMLSFWRNDVGRNLTERAAHLLDKTYSALEWVWIVGDSTDGTTEALEDVVRSHPRRYSCAVIDIGDTGIRGDDPNTRLHRLGVTAQAALDEVTIADDWVIIHESDIQSPPDIVEGLLTSGQEMEVPLPMSRVMGAWPVLGAAPMFYDIWAYRGLDGQHFTNYPPYHAVYRPDAPFEVQSVGTVWGFPAAAMRAGMRCTTWGCVEMCAELRAQGYHIWVDPRIEVVQPIALWTAQRFPTEVA